MNKSIKILITGGLGFIGVNLIDLLLAKTNYEILNIDKITYASNKKFINSKKNKKYKFKQIDICDYKKTNQIISRFKPDKIIHLAAETHVDRSIKDSMNFFNSNIFGTYNLLVSSKNYFKNLSSKKKSQFVFFYISTDEVYGDLSHSKIPSKESDILNPSSPYSASKASSELLVKAWNRTYNLPYLISRTTNNFGPYQNKEKLIPNTIDSLLNKKSVSIYGNGSQIRDWIFVRDNAEAIFLILENSKKNCVYNISSGNYITNLYLVKTIYKKLKHKIKKNQYKIVLKKHFIQFVTDRAGHDKKYYVNSNKIKKDLKWKTKTDFDEAIDLTIDWYLDKYIVKNK
jgi:dTDP-glucose 4,6-dehydratase